MRTVAPTLAANARRAPLPARRCDRGTTSTSRLRAPPPGRGGPVGTVPSENDAPSSSVASTAHGTPRWREFTLAFAGGWRGRSVEFDARGVARDIPIRYVHGVGRVPRANMPFADEDFDWVTRCECVSTDDGVRIDASRAMPEIGNEDAISSCGAAEWNDGAELVIADETLRILRGPGEDKTILPDGSFSAGARTLPTRPRATNDDDDAETDVTVVHQCLADPSDANRRVRIVQRVAFDAAAKNHRAVSCDAWMEHRERSCPRGFSDAPRVDTIAPNGKAWVRSPSASSGSGRRRRTGTRGGVAAVPQSRRQVGSGDAGAGEAGGRGAGLVDRSMVEGLTIGACGGAFRRRMNNSEKFDCYLKTATRR